MPINYGIPVPSETYLLQLLRLQRLSLVKVQMPLQYIPIWKIKVHNHKFVLDAVNRIAFCQSIYHDMFKEIKKMVSEGFNKVFLQNLIIVYNTCHDHRGMHICTCWYIKFNWYQLTCLQNSNAGKKFPEITNPTKMQKNPIP